jgi:hypothetical protein
MGTDPIDPKYLRAAPVSQQPQIEPIPSEGRTDRPVMLPGRQPTRWPTLAPRPEPLLETIRRLSKERKIGFLKHAEERLAERGFDIFDVFGTLENGYIDGPIKAGAKEGEWKAKVVDVPEGRSRKMGVITIVVKEQRLLIKTVEWEDR